MVAVSEEKRWFPHLVEEGLAWAVAASYLAELEWEHEAVLTTTELAEVTLAPAHLAGYCYMHCILLHCVCVCV